MLLLFLQAAIWLTPKTTIAASGLPLTALRKEWRVRVVTGRKKSGNRPATLGNLKAGALPRILPRRVRMAAAGLLELELPTATKCRMTPRGITLVHGVEAGSKAAAGARSHLGPSSGSPDPADGTAADIEEIHQKSETGKRGVCFVRHSD